MPVRDGANGLTEPR